MFRTFSLANAGLAIGSVLTVVGFVAYFLNQPTLNLAGFFYGIPLFLGGLALKTSELKPVPFSQPTPPEVLALREQQATTTQNQICKDVMRYQFGQTVHLERALEYLSLKSNDGEHPVLTGLREVVVDGAYTLVLEFDSPTLPLEKWTKQQQQMTKYFGPGVRVELTQPQPERVEVWLVVAPASVGDTPSTDAPTNAETDAETVG